MKKRKRKKAPELPDHVIAVRCQNAAERKRRNMHNSQSSKKINKAKRQKRLVRSHHARYFPLWRDCQDPVTRAEAEEQEQPLPVATEEREAMRRGDDEHIEAVPLFPPTPSSLA